MKPNISFDVDFDYALSEKVTIRLTANVQLRHSTSRYIVSNFRFKNNLHGSPPLDDVNIIAIRSKKNSSRVHVDSRKETELSMAIGKAIETKPVVETVTKI
ncbi:MAG TPA: hypothetical protein VFW07_23320 [Parafilimonas sp.]|nr:hypothetical protein [Parafilimonas sp.]